MPGYLLPHDLIEIGTRVSNGVTREFLSGYLLASEGAVVQTGDQRFRIPTIVPAQKADGSCVFLNEHDRCTIHDIAPFGCAYFDTHMTNEQADDLSSCGLHTILADFRENGLYRAVYETLASSGRTAPPLHERRKRLSVAF